MLTQTFFLINSSSQGDDATKTQDATGNGGE